MSVEQVHVNPWFQVTRRTSDGLDWFRVQRPDSAMLIGSTLDGRLLLLRGIRDTTGKEMLFEFPCGAVDDGESPADAAKRETAEESGYAVRDLKPLGRFVEAPGISSAVCHVFVASLAQRGESHLEPGESWTSTLVDEQRLRELVANSRIRDAGTLSAIALRAASRA